MTFTKRPLVAGATLGDRLRSLRVDAGLSVEAVGQAISVAPKYLMAIEESRYQALPGLVYARQFVRRYAEALETDVDMAMGIFEQEYTVVTKARPSSRPLLTPRVNTEFPWYRRHVRVLIAIVAVLIVGSYLGVQAARNFLPPKLSVTSPSTDVATNDLQYTITGSTDPTATVTINDQNVQTASNGTFSVTIDLRVGVNTLDIAAKKKHSSSRIITRHILVEQ